MGPILLLDKSSFQTFSHDEDLILFRHYYISIAPTLIKEIVVDFTKPQQEGNFSRNDAQWLARKMPPISFGVCVNHQKAIAASLLGNPVPMTGQILIDPDTTVRVPGPNNTYGVVMEESPEMRAIHNWQDGKFTEVEREFSAQIRKTLHEPLLEEFRKANPPQDETIRKAKNLKELLTIIDASLNAPNTDIQLKELQACLKMIDAPEAVRTAVNNRWVANNLPQFSRFAPYAFYCWRVYTLFILGISKGLVPTKTNSVIDVEYLYYLPFCQIFSSRDRLHLAMAPLFLRPNQTFVNGDTLKKDLKWLSEEWASLSEQTKEYRRLHYGSYPPENNELFTYQMWNKYAKPRTQYSGNIASTLSPEQHKQILDEVRLKMAAYNKPRKSKNRTDSEPS